MLMYLCVFVQLSQNRPFSQSFNVNNFSYGVRLCVLHSHAGFQKAKVMRTGSSDQPTFAPHPTAASVPPNTVGTPSAPEAPPEWNAGASFEGPFIPHHHVQCVHTHTHNFPRAAKQRAAGSISPKKMWEKEPLGFC